MKTKSHLPQQTARHPIKTQTMKKDEPRMAMRGEPKPPPQKSRTKKGKRG